VVVDAATIGPCGRSEEEDSAAAPSGPRDSETTGQRGNCAEEEKTRADSSEVVQALRIPGRAWRKNGDCAPGWMTCRTRTPVGGKGRRARRKSLYVGPRTQRLKLRMRARVSGCRWAPPVSAGARLSHVGGYWLSGLRGELLRWAGSIGFSPCASFSFFILLFLFLIYIFPISFEFKFHT
jgi:hypothetical protein